MPRPSRFAPPILSWQALRDGRNSGRVGCGPDRAGAAVAGAAGHRPGPGTGQASDPAPSLPAVESCDGPVVLDHWPVVDHSRAGRLSPPDRRPAVPPDSHRSASRPRGGRAPPRNHSPGRRRQRPGTRRGGRPRRQAAPGRRPRRARRGSRGSRPGRRQARGPMPWPARRARSSAGTPVLVIAALGVQRDGLADAGGLEGGPQRGALVLWQPRLGAERVPLPRLHQVVAGGAGVPVPTGQHDQRVADQDRGEPVASGRVAPGGRGGGAEVAGAVVAGGGGAALGGLQVLEGGDGGLGGVGEGVVAPAGKLGGVGRAGDLAGGQQLAVAVGDLPGEGQVLPAGVEYPQLRRRDLVSGVGAHPAGPSWGGTGGWAGVPSLARSAAYKAWYSWKWASWSKRC